MSETSKADITVAGNGFTAEKALNRIISYPRRTPVIYDFEGTGDPNLLTADEIKRTRKISSRISNEQLEYFLNMAPTAPWIHAGADLAEADPSSGQLFTRMTELYWHFADIAPPGIKCGKISKVLHLKQPALYPILDSRLRRSYAFAAKELKPEYPSLGWRRRTWVAIRNDLISSRASDGLAMLRQKLHGFESRDSKEQERVRRLNDLTDLRLLDILVW